MPLIRFLKDKFNEFEVLMGANLMNSLKEKNIPVASSCGGEGVCTKCKVIILKGKTSLSIDLSCQTHVFEDITIDATYW